MAFAQLTYRETLRDIESCLRALQSRLYHMGFRGKVSRSTPADANESHDWRIFADFAQGLIATARPLHPCDLMGVDLHQSLYALDSTAIDLCLSLFPWAKFRQRKAAVKMHTLLDLHGNIPTFIRVTSGAERRSCRPNRDGEILSSRDFRHSTRSLETLVDGKGNLRLDEPEIAAFLSYGEDRGHFRQQRRPGVAHRGTILFQ
jgi:hypothetical protein